MTHHSKRNKIKKRGKIFLVVVIVVLAILIFSYKQTSKISIEKKSEKDSSEVETAQSDVEQKGEKGSSEAGTEEGSSEAGAEEGSSEAGTSQLDTDCSIERDNCYLGKAINENTVGFCFVCENEEIKKDCLEHFKIEITKDMEMMAVQQDIGCDSAYEWCLAEEAKKIGDKELCFAVSDADIRLHCLAHLENDVSYCSEIQQSELRNMCIGIS